MKQFENKNGNFLVSKDVELDTDDLVEEENKSGKTFKELEDKISRLVKEKTDDDFVSKSTCLIHLYFSDDEKISGTLESYKKYCKFSILRGWREPRNWESREIIFWAGYDALVSYIKKSDEKYINKITLEHIAGHEQQFIKENRLYFGEFEIIEIIGPLFKIKLELLVTI